jgi:hypothetical protein
MNSNSINYSLLALMIIQCFLSGFTFNGLQIFTEIVIFIILINRLLVIKLDKADFILLIIIAIVFSFSLILNDIKTSLLNFKMFGLTALILIYFNKVEFYPKTFLKLFVILNIVYVFSTKFLGFWPIESSSFFFKQSAFLYSRPVAFLSSPHVLSTFLAIYFLYLAFTKQSRILQVLILISLFIISSYTAVIALIFSLIYHMIPKIIGKSLNPILFFGLILCFSYISIETLLYFLGDQDKFSRAYSIQIILPMIFDTSYFNGISLFPLNHDYFVLQQESYFFDVGNEIGLIKVLVEGGVILGIYILYFIIKKVKFYAVFLLFTLLHYSFFINVPIVLFLAIILNNEVLKKTNKIQTKS